MLIIENPDGKVLLQKRPPAGIWGGLWSFPEITDNTANNKALSQKTWEVLRHTFSHFHLDITPIYLQQEEAHSTGLFTDNALNESAQVLWYDLHSPQKVGLAAPVNKLLNTVKSRRSSANKIKELS